MDKHIVKGETDIYRHGQRTYCILLSGGIIFAVLIFVASLCIGNYKTTPTDVISALINPRANAQVYK